MNRTARCIRMLMILKSRDSVCTAELAELLETNPRNIREYKKELEEAGYHIQTIRGAGGGYRLGSSALLPLPAFDAEAVDTLRTMRDSLLSQPNLAYSQSGAKLLDSIIAANPAVEVDQPIFFTPSRLRDFPKDGKDCLSRIRKAIVDGNQIEIIYHSKAGVVPVKRVVDPYDVVCSDGKWYFVGFDHSHEEFRTFRISTKRLLELKVLDSHFERDPNFVLKNYIGTSALVREDMEIYMVEVRKDAVRFFEEIKWGKSFSRIGEQHKGWITYSFFSDDSTHVLRTLFRLGDDVRLLTPIRRRNEFVKKLRSILSVYEEIDVPL